MKSWQASQSSSRVGLGVEIDGNKGKNCAFTMEGTIFLCSIRAILGRFVHFYYEKHKNGRKNCATG